MRISGLAKLIEAKKKERNYTVEQMLVYLEVSKGTYTTLMKKEEVKSLDKIVFFIDLFGEPLKLLLVDQLKLLESNSKKKEITLNDIVIESQKQTELLKKIAEKI